MNSDENSSPRVVVVGSMNIDHTLLVATLPQPGETVTSEGYYSAFGGKGANQAIAARRAGATVWMVGCVGNDDHGRSYMNYLSHQRIEVAAVTGVPAPTGSAFILVDQAGENNIVVNPGANHLFTADLLERCRDIVAQADCVLLQLECPVDVIERAADIASSAGVRVILNPSPWQDTAAALAQAADVVIVNEKEANSLASALQSTRRKAGESEITTLVVTCGAEATQVIAAKGERHDFRPPKVTPVDTVGAGDTFAGSFAAVYAAGASIGEATEYANAAAALATLGRGAQGSIPEREEVARFMRGNLGTGQAGH